ncbi:MAG TPA: site-specific integrase [Candidatus Dormibacteraeota bacterium]
MSSQRRPRASALRLDQAVDEYLAWLELDRHRSPRTVTEYRADLQRFLDFAAAAGVARTAAVDRDLIRAYQRRVSSQRLSPATRQRRLVALRSFLRFAALEEWTARDLALAIDLPTLPERLPKPLEDVDRERLVEELPAATPAEKRAAPWCGCCSPPGPASARSSASTAVTGPGSASPSWARATRSWRTCPS